METQSQEGYGYVRFGFSLIGYFVGLILLQDWAFVLAPIPVAVYWAFGRTDRAWCFIAVGIAAAITMLMVIAIVASLMPDLTISFGPVIALLAFPFLGIHIGNGFRFAKTYNEQVVTLILIAGIFTVALMGFRWNALGVFFDDHSQSIEELVADPERDLSAAVEQNLNMQLWVFEHWPSFVPGTMLGAVVLLSCVSVSMMARGIRRGGMPVNGSFLIFRPPEPLVWLVIVTAIFWYLNYQTPSPGLQIFSWNTAILWTVLYSMNGLSVVTYGVALMKPHPVLLLALAGLLFLTGLQFLAIVGLFDTWGDFRKKIDRRLTELKTLSDEDR